MTKVALITGSARRIGAEIARTLHNSGYNVVIHYHRSSEDAEALAADLNQQRADSARTISADLLNVADFSNWITEVVSFWGRLDALVNNASTFYPTPLAEANEQHWEDLFGTNLKAPYFLSLACAKHLAKDGNIICISDTHTQMPLKNYSIYTIAKSGLTMLCKSLAKELSPIRVNAIAPGAILWPEGENELNPTEQEKLANKAALKRIGSPDEIAKAVKFLITEATFTTGHTLHVDGGRF